MRARFPGLLVACTLLLAFLASPSSAQTGTLAGQVLDAQTSQPLANAQVQALQDGGAVGGGLTDAQGRFRVQLPVGTYTVRVELVGYRTETLGADEAVQVLASQVTDLTIRLAESAFQLEQLVVTGRRTGEKALESPNNILIISGDRIQERTALTPVEHVKALPGVDVAQSGLTSSNVVARGFNNVFSGALLVITDNRYASVPSLRFNAHNMIAANQFDVERVEVLLGPAAALYGPNSASGVLHLITSSPIDDPGTKISLSSGSRNLAFGQFRTAWSPNERFGFKVSGQYFQGDEWEFDDPAEVAARQENPEFPERDYDLERYGGEVRFDFRPSPGTEIIVNAGVNNLATGIEMTGIGSGQAQDWLYSYGQIRLNRGRFFAQAFMNQSDAGDTFLFRTNQPIVDKSRMMVAQVQHGFALGETQDFIYGVDLQRTEPRTEGTITGANEDDDNINEVGGYLHSETDLSENLKLVGALRVDYHNRLEDLVYSPRAALVFEPAVNQAFRLTYNRAFSTPTTNNLFLDIVAARVPVFGPFAYDVRTKGVPESGFTFNDTCAGGVGNFCMYSPFAPQAGQLPANALPFWNDLISAVLTGAGAQGLIPVLSNPGAAPGDPDVASWLLRFNQEAGTFLPDDGPEPIERILPTIYNTFELGYKGILGERLSVSVDLYSQQIKDFVGPLRTETPNVFYEPNSAGAFIIKRLQENGLLGTVVTQEEAEAIIRGMASIPVGTVAPDQVDSSDLILSYRNFGDVDIWGSDFAMQFFATDRLSFTGNYSHVSEECVDFDDDGDCSGARDVALNAPQNKGALGLRWDDQDRGYAFDTRVRFTEGFPMNSGVFIGDVDGYTVVDANLSYRLPFAPGASVGLTATNLFDNVHQEFVGAPFLGRMIMARMQYEF